MFATAPLPPSLDAAGQAIVQYLEAHRFTFPHGVRFVGLPDGEQMPLAATGPLGLAQVQTSAGAYPDGTILIGPRFVTVQDASPTGTLAGQVVDVLEHEALHETATGGADAYYGEAQTFATEQAVSAQAEDLRAGLRRYVARATGLTVDTSAAYSYTDLVKNERVWSARLCRCGWTSPAARAVRASFFLTPAAQRQVVMPAQAADPSAIVAHIA